MKVEKKDVYAFFKGEQKFKLEDIEKYIDEEKFDINSPNEDGFNILHYACQKRNIEWVKFLIKKNCDLNAIWNSCVNDDTIFMLFCGFSGIDNDDDSPIEIIKLFLENKTLDINRLNNFGRNALFFSCDYGSSFKTAKLLIENPGVNLNQQDMFGTTVLIYLCGNIDQEDWYIEVIELLINKGCDMNLKDKRGYTALMYLSLSGEGERNIKAVKLLLQSKKCKFDVKNNENYDHLMFACLHRRYKIAQLLLDYGHPINPGPHYGEYEKVVTAHFTRQRNGIGILLMHNKYESKSNMQKKRNFDEINENPLNILPKELIHLILSYSHPWAPQTKYCQN